MKSEKTNWWKLAAIALIIILLVVVYYKINQKQDIVEYNGFEITRAKLDLLMENYEIGDKVRVCDIIENKCLIVERLE